MQCTNNLGGIAAGGIAQGEGQSPAGDAIGDAGASAPYGDGAAPGYSRAGEPDVANRTVMAGTGLPVWHLPPPSLLRRVAEKPPDRREVAAAGHALVAALQAHGVETRLAGQTVGPSITRYELELAPGVKVSRVTSLSRDIAYALAAADVRILAPIPGKSAVGVEVANAARQLVLLGDLLASSESRSARHPLDVPVGRDISGRVVIANLADMPHVLISGATGAGKSSCINSILTSLVMRATPEELRLVLVDPKRVELGHYAGLPHLLTAPVVEPKRAANALAWAVKEMEHRYELLAGVGARDIGSYNSYCAEAMASASPDRKKKRRGAITDASQESLALFPDGEPPKKLPYILVVVDELNDLMMVAARDVEDSVCRIAQMARAVGIHLVLATQRPSVNVITGVIKANIPARLAFAVSSLADSRVILDQPGAERLIGKGDFLLVTASSSTPQRLQGPWVSESEVRQVVAHWRRQGSPSYEEALDVEEARGVAGESGGEDEELFEQALELVVRSQLGSTSMLQRKLRIGFARAGRLMDLLERRGVVGPAEGSRARAVLMTPDELDRR